MGASCCGLCGRGPSPSPPPSQSDDALPAEIPPFKAPPAERPPIMDITRVPIYTPFKAPPVECRFKAPPPVLREERYL